LRRGDEKRGHLLVSPYFLICYLFSPISAIWGKIRGHLQVSPLLIDLILNIHIN